MLFRSLEGVLLERPTTVQKAPGAPETPVWPGHTPDYLRILLGRAGAEEDLWNRTVRVRILGIVEDHKNQDIAFEVRLL